MAGYRTEAIGGHEKPKTNKLWEQFAQYSQQKSQKVASGASAPSIFIQAGGYRQ